MGNTACCERPVRANDHKRYIRRAGSAAAGTGAPQSARLHRTSSLRVNSTRRLSTKNVPPDRNLLVIALVAGFKETLKERFKSSEEAFRKIAGDDDNIDAAMLNEFLIHIGNSNSNLNAQMFQYLDKDKDGYISKPEFDELCAGHDEHVADFKERLLAECETVKDAFHKLDTSYDNLIDYDEFEDFCTNDLGYTDLQLVKRIFEAIDDDQNAVISNAEFKALFDTAGEFGLVIEFKEAIKAKFKSSMEAFEQLGGENGVIDRGEFQERLDDLLGYTRKELVDQLFNVIDDNHDGYISRNEFRALFCPQGFQLMEFRQSVRNKYKTRNLAFNKFGGKENGQISLQSFHERCARNFGLKDKAKNEQLFRMIDCDGDAAISRDEFKKFFRFSHSNELGSSGLGKQPAASLSEDEKQPAASFNEDDHPSLQKPNVGQLFRMIDSNGDAGISSDEFKAFFKRLDDPGFGNQPDASLSADKHPSVQDTDAEQTDAGVTSDASLDDVQDTSDGSLMEPKPPLKLS